MIVFLLQVVIPADPARAMVGASGPKSVVIAKGQELGYDKPIPQRFLDFMGRMFQGNLQESLRTRNSVSKDVATFAPATLELALAAAAIAGVLGVGLGLMLAGAGRIARALRLALIAGAPVPAFPTAPLAILLLYSLPPLLPA